MAESDSEYGDEKCSSGSDFEGEDSDSDEDWDDEDDEDEEYKGKSLLWLVQEGLMPEARRRFEALQSSSSLKEKEMLKKQIFQQSRDDGNYPLHEILMGGTMDSNAHRLALSILEYCRTNCNPAGVIKMLSCQPKSHQRTCLHWALWSNSKLDIIQPLVWSYPEALIIRDAKDKGHRTPLEIYLRYHCFLTQGTIDERREFLLRCQESWVQHRLRLSVHLSAIHIFVTKQLNPFNHQHRRECNMKPRPWFVLSVLGYCMQREMKPLVLHLLSFVGRDAKVYCRASSKKRKRKQKKNK